MTYKIEYKYDETDCETCGYSCAEGYVIYKDNVIVIDKTPFAHSYNGTDYYSDNAYRDILELAGIIVEEVHSDYPKYSDHWVEESVDE